MNKKEQSETQSLGERFVKGPVLAINTWNKPGVRYRGLSDKFFAALSNSHYRVAKLTDGTDVRPKDDWQKRYVFDGKGRLIKVEDDGLHSTRLTYDHLGRVVERTSFATELNLFTKHSIIYSYDSEENDVYSASVREERSIGLNGGP